jgi:hypothetical protein
MFMASAEHGRTFGYLGAVWMDRSLRAWLAAVAVGCVATTLYLSMRSISLDDFDSVSFALALREFNLALQQPHPPGYPAYIGVARLIGILGGDATWTLTTLSALAGGVAVAATVGLGYVVGGGSLRTGVLAASPMAMMPVFWLTAELALSDMPALAAGLLAALAVASRPRSAPGLGVAGLAAGFVLGFRPQNVLLIAPFALYTLFTLLRTRRPRAAMLFVLAGLVGVAVWLVPLIAVSGGLQTYAALVRAEGNHFWTADSLFGSSQPVDTELSARMADFAHIFVGQALGVGAGVAPPGLVTLLALLSVPIAAVMLNRRNSWVWVASAAFVLCLAQYFALESLERSRLMLPFLATLFLLLALILTRVPPWASGSLVAVACVALGTRSWPLAQVLASQPTPPAQAVAYARQRFPQADSLVATAGSFRHVQYYGLADYRLHYLYFLDESALRADIARGSYRWLLVFDPDEFQTAIGSPFDGSAYVTLDDLTFRRDPMAYPQHSEVHLRVLARPDLVPASELQLPASSKLLVGHAGDERYVGSGWFAHEDVGGIAARWSGGSSAADIRVLLPHRNYRMRFFAAAFPKDQSLSVQVNGREVGRLPMTRDWAEYEIGIPASVLTEPITTIRLQHSRLASPQDDTGGQSSDPRLLAAAYSWFAFTAAP